MTDEELAKLLNQTLFMGARCTSAVLSDELWHTEVIGLPELDQPVAAEIKRIRSRVWDRMSAHAPRCSLCAGEIWVRSYKILVLCYQCGGDAEENYNARHGKKSEWPPR